MIRQNKIKTWFPKKGQWVMGKSGAHTGRMGTIKWSHGLTMGVVFDNEPPVVLRHRDVWPVGVYPEGWISLDCDEGRHYQNNPEDRLPPEEEP